MGTTAKVLTLAAAGAAVAAAAWAVRDIPAQLGAKPSGARGARVRRSLQFANGKFRNEVPATMMPPGGMRETFRELIFGKQPRKPASAVPVVTPTHPELSADGLSVVW